MSAPRHLSRVLFEILAIVDPVAFSSETSAEEIFEEREKLRRLAKHLRRKAPEQIRPSQWDSAEVPYDEIIGFLDEPDKGTVEAIWTGSETSRSPAARGYCLDVITKLPDSALAGAAGWLSDIEERYGDEKRSQKGVR